jgi:GMP synthase-like glutamine amidotransferase
MDVLVIEHMDMAGPGALGAVLETAGARLDLRDAGAGDAMPADADGHQGLVVLGGMMNANDDAGYPHLAACVELIRAFHARGKPVLGICLGGQLIARAFDAAVWRGGARERGFVPIAHTQAAARDALLAGLAPPHWLMQWHDDSFEVPAGAARLMTNEACRNQAFRIGEATYAFQCHFEVTRPLVETWLASCEAPPTDPIDIDFFGRIDDELTRHVDASMAFCDAVGRRWAALVAARRAG